MSHTIDRRRLLAGAAASVGLGAWPSISQAQGAAPIRIGTLTPLTGSGGPYGPVMANCARPWSTR
jgi:branched-chain amino acid transport system substrate-binding protein